MIFGSKVKSLGGNQKAGSSRVNIPEEWVQVKHCVRQHNALRRGYFYEHVDYLVEALGEYACTMPSISLHASERHLNYGNTSQCAAFISIFHK